MENKSVKIVVNENLCISCGLCKNICPKHAITYIKDRGMYIPKISDECISCGVCLEICPGRKFVYSENCSIENAIKGENLKNIYVTWSKDKNLRHEGASGGTLSTMVRFLLNNSVYDCAFSVNSYHCNLQLKTEICDKETYNHILETSNLKSKYLPISHEETVKYILSNKNKRVIFIGTSCAIRGLKNIINKFKLNMNNYLFLGLFCDKVFQYNIYEYFSSTKFCENKELFMVNFKNKESGGWPGNMKFYFKDGTYKYIDKTERAKVKDYFVPERCNYCIDKLNITADISFGDNYTGRNETKLGSNSVIVRTDIGEKMWNIVKDQLEYCNSSIEEIIKGQWMVGRLENLNYAQLKEYDISTKINVGIDYPKVKKGSRKKYKLVLKKLKVGAEYKRKQFDLDKFIKDDKKRNNRINHWNKFRIKLSKIYHLLKGS